MNTSTPWEPYRVCELKKKGNTRGHVAHQDLTIVKGDKA